MQNLAFEFDSEMELRDMVNKLWEGLGVTGEMAIRPLNGGRWRLELMSENAMRDSTLETFANYRVEAGD